MPSPTANAFSKHKEEQTSAIPGGYFVRKGRKAGGRNLIGKDPAPAASLPRESGPDPLLKGMIRDIAKAPWADKEAAPEWTPGTRRLRQIPRSEQRPMESRLYHLRHVHRDSDAKISHLLDLHPDDLDALAATHGQL